MRRSRLREGISTISFHRFSVAARFLGVILLAAGFVLSVGSQPTLSGAVSAGSPTIEITSVPLAGTDNPDKLSTIKGRVAGAQPGQQIVLYAKASTAWWVQPFADHPFTAIRANSTWQNFTHPGTEYAALLVGPGFRAPLTTTLLPTEGVLASAVAKGTVPFWQSWRFPVLCVLIAALAALGLHRLRVLQMSRTLNQRFEERLAERTLVAQELHDTLLQGLLSASMQLHVAVDQLPENSSVRPALNRVLQMMEQIVDEGRNTVRGLRSSVDSAHDLKTSFSRIPQELGNHDGANFNVAVAGPSRPMRPVIRDEVYSICREAVVNAFRHSQARNIGVELEYSASQLRVVVWDDGCGIDSRVLESGRDGHWGLSGMRERAQRIGSNLKVRSRSGDGTDVELRVPGDIAFESHPSKPESKLLKDLYRRGAMAARPVSKKRA